MLAYQISMNCPNQRYVQKILKANINLPRSCKWLSFTKGKRPFPFKNTVTMAIVVMADTNIEAKMYHANRALYQCGVSDMNQSQDMVASVVIKNTKKKTANLKFCL